MQISSPLTDTDLANGWSALHNQAHNGMALQQNSNRLAFADPEFMFRRETRGIRMQLELLKPDLAQIERGIEHTVVVYGSARFVDWSRPSSNWPTHRPAAIPSALPWPSAPCAMRTAMNRPAPSRASWPPTA